jgi:L-cysteine:1D-myo-inositol 2-amino-2-deoxy-alpha-D-glucopyranoside ligase
MRSWPSVDVPHIAGEPPPLRLLDTRSRSFVTLDPGGSARMYVCGITPYDATHLGHASTYLTFDLLNRQWLDRGVDVRYVQNVTDVDDPLLERAEATGVDWTSVASEGIDLFRDDMAALRILPPREWCGVIESMSQIADLIDQLGEAVYRVDGDVYFDITSTPEFGTVSGLDDATMLKLFAERGGDPERPGKRHPLDCLLWRAARDDEPSWDSAWGPGRPGWHIECAAIAQAHLGSDIDVIGGGSDLVFPHHEMSAAESELATGEPAARTYVHAGMVAYQGAKMAKSDGNLVFVSDLRAAGHDPMAIRLALLSHRYGDDWEWHDQEILDAGERLARWRTAVHRESGDAAQPVIDEIRTHLAGNLNAPDALKTVDAWCERSGSDRREGRTLSQAIDALLGIQL